jgi:hypothetical protein
MGAPGRIVAGRSFTLLALSILMATACVEDGTAADAALRPFTRADVNLIVLGPNDAPGGTAYVEDASGFHDLDAFARDDIERSHLVDDGFEVGHVALFLPPASANGPSPEPLTNDSVIVQGIAGLFHDADGAESSLQRYVQDLRSRQIPDASDVPAGGLGDTSFGLRGETPDGSRVQIFVWRIGNLLLAISGSGPVMPEDVRALADLIDGRT